MKKFLISVSTATGTAFLVAQNALAAETVNLRPGGSFAGLPTDTPIGKIVGVVLQVLLVVAAIVFFVMLLVGGIRWILSGGDKTGTQNARSQITAALIGLVIVFSAWLIAGLIGRIFNVDIFNITLPTLSL